jgi:hypothetical protein
LRAQTAIPHSHITEKQFNGRGNNNDEITGGWAVSNVTKLPGVFRQDAIQIVQDFDYSDFCALLESGVAENVSHINGMTILNLPRCSIICNGDRCTSIIAVGANIDRMIEEAHERLEPICAAG